MEQEELNKRLQPLLDRIIPLYKSGSLEKEQEDFWATRAALTFNQPGVIDRGIFSVYFFNLLHLKYQQAIFQDANLPHAYLEGQNMEIMANSDNVLRGGLTVKHIDVDELMRHVNFEPTIPNVLTVRHRPHQPDIFETPARDFELQQLILGTDAAELKSKTAEVFFVYKGPVQVTEGKDSLMLQSGEAMLASAGASFSLNGLNALVFRATVPS